MPEVQHPRSIPALLRVDELSLAETGGDEWTTLASIDERWLGWEDRLRHCHERYAALVRVDDLESLDHALTRGGEFEALGSPDDGGSVFPHSLYGVELEPVAYRSAVWPGRILEISPAVPALLDLRGRELAKDEVVYVDERLNQEVLRLRHGLGDRRLSTVKIRTAALRQFLAERDQALVLYHFHQHLLRHFTDTEAGEHEIVAGSLSGSIPVGLKTFVQNWGPRGRAWSGDDAYLQRRIHRWRVLRPEDARTRRTRHEHLAFDVRTFTLETLHGPVAPARFCALDIPAAEFAGVWPNETPAFMTRTWFDIAVLERFEHDPNYDVGDDGSIRCRHYWALNRSVQRTGNRWLSTAIGDFAEGVPMEEWPYFARYAVPPPGDSEYDEACREQEIPDLVNALVDALERMAATPSWFAAEGTEPPAAIWNLKSDPRPLKRHMGSTTDKTEFARRVTELSTLLIDGLDKAALIGAVEALAGMRAPNEHRSQGSRKWLEAYATACRIARYLRTMEPAALAGPVRLGLAWATATGEQLEAAREYQQAAGEIRGALAPIAYLYDLRTSGGVAHPPSAGWAEALAKVAGDSEQVGRRGYLALLTAVGEAVRLIVEDVRAAARMGCG